MVKHISSYKDFLWQWRDERNCFFIDLRAIGGKRRTTFKIKTEMWRLRDKGSPLKDAQKARFYLDRLIEKLG